MESVSSITELLQVYGSWGLCAILFVVIFFLARYIKSMNEQRLEASQKYNEKLLNLLERRVESDVKHAQAFKNLRVVVERLISKI